MAKPTPAPGKSHGNPHLKHIDRAPYELGQLLKSISADFSEFKEQTPETYLKIEAAVTHATNATTTLMSGLESLGSILFVATANNGFEVDKGDIANLGCLISHLAVEAQFMHETTSWYEFALSEREKRAKKKS